MTCAARSKYLTITIILILSVVYSFSRKPLVVPNSVPSIRIRATLLKIHTVVLKIINIVRDKSIYPFFYLGIS